MRPDLPAIRLSAAGLSASLAAATIAVQFCAPLLHGTVLDADITLSVLLFTAASVAHCWYRFGLRGVLGLLTAAGGLGFAAEVLGVHTGLPFGEYRYTGLRGPRVLNVPLLAPLAWTMMAYPCQILARHLVRRRGPARPLVAALALASWDLYLDPQMVAAGQWVYLRPTPTLPGIPHVPAENFAGWLLVALVIETALTVLLSRAPARTSLSRVPGRKLPSRVPARDSDAGSLRADQIPARWADRTPAVLLAWTWLGSAVANLLFYWRPLLALWGGIGMGITVLPFLLRCRRPSPAEGACEESQEERDQPREGRMGSQEEQVHEREDRPAGARRRP